MNSFHGRTVTTVAATGQDTFHHYFNPFTERFTYAQANDIESVKSLLDENTCAVFIEMIQGEGGVMPLEPHFVKELEKLCKKHDVLLMVDEVQTGMGRTGTLFCYEQYGIEPDVITSSKALGGGYAHWCVSVYRTLGRRTEQRGRMVLPLVETLLHVQAP